MSKAIEVELDGRQRLPLSKTGFKVAKRYRVYESANGELRLVPVFSLTQDELQQAIDAGGCVLANG